MRMETSISHAMIEPDYCTILNVSWFYCIPGVGSVDSLSIDSQGLGTVLKQPNVVLIFVRVKCNLLLLAPSWIHVIVGMKITPLSIVVAKGDSAAHYDIHWNILHGLRIQGGLELRGHEAIAITRVNQAEEMDTKKSHIERHRDTDQAEHTSEEVFEP